MSNASTITLSQLYTLAPSRAPCSQILDALLRLISTPRNVCLPTEFIFHLHQQGYRATVQQERITSLIQVNTIVIPLSNKAKALWGLLLYSRRQVA